MTRLEHLQFLALMTPTLIVLAAATLSLAAPASSVPGKAEFARVVPMDEAGHEATY